MNKRKIVIISVVIFISLLGSLFVQSFWVNNAYKLKAKQLDKSVLIALKTVVNKLLEYQNKYESFKMEFEGCKVDEHPMVKNIKPEMLEKTMRLELESIGIVSDYEYGIYHSKTGQFLMGKITKFKNRIIDSDHYVRLNCLNNSEQYILAVYIDNKHEIIISRILIWVILSLLFMLMMAIAFYYSVAAILQQKRLSVMKTDFVNNMTHEFKTPISTISLASEMLLKKEVQASSEKTKKYAGIIFAENDRLKNQVEQVLQISVLDKGKYKLKKRQVDIHQLIETQMKNFSLLIKDRKGTLVWNLEATKSKIDVDRIHITNVISNLLDNAVKYSPEAPQIKVSTKSTPKGFYLKIKDKGIGIKNENQKEIFKNLYRVPTGNLHDVKGFGLGLYYVKKIVEAHGGTVNVKSEFKKGSEFVVFLPFNKNETDSAQENNTEQNK